MPAGLEVFNDDYVLQVTEAYRNYLFDYKVTITATSQSTWPRYGWFYVLTTEVDCMVACAAGNGIFVGVHSTQVSGSTMTHNFHTPYECSIGAPQATFYVFSLRKQPPNVLFGLEIYDEQGRLGFSSNLLYMKPLKTWSGQDYTNNNSLNFVTLPTGFGLYGRYISDPLPQDSAFFIAGPAGYYKTTILSDGDGWYNWDNDIYGAALGKLNGSIFIADALLGGRSQGPSQTIPSNVNYDYKQFYHMMVNVSDL